MRGRRSLPCGRHLLGILLLSSLTNAHTTSHNFFEFLIPLFFLEIHPFSMQLKWFQRSNPNPEKYFKVIRSDSSHNKSQQAPHYDIWMHRHSDAVFQKQRAPKKYRNYENVNVIRRKNPNTIIFKHFLLQVGHRHIVRPR